MIFHLHIVKSAFKYLAAGVTHVMAFLLCNKDLLVTTKKRYRSAEIKAVKISKYLEISGTT